MGGRAMKVVELFVVQVPRRRVDGPLYDAVALLLPETGLGECYLEVVRRYPDREEIISPDRAVPAVAAAYAQLEALVGRNAAWMRTVSD
jgi:hypothetical protein